MKLQNSKENQIKETPEEKINRIFWQKRQMTVYDYKELIPESMKQRIALIDVDGHNFPNLPLMKLSAYHKKRGDSVEWYDPLFHNVMISPPFDRAYISKVFTFTSDYEYPINANEIFKGGTGYFYPDGGEPLPEEIEHIYPDYSLYGVKNKAYGFLTRGCPRNCDFCIVGKKEGTKSIKVANLEEFWRGQKEIILLDPNILACRDHEQLLQQLADSHAWVDFTQGLDARLLTERNIKIIQKIKIKMIHFAWDKLEDEKKILKKLKLFKELTGIVRRKTVVYILTNFNTTHEEDLYRIYTLRNMGYNPYVMIYEKETAPEICKKVQRWVNCRQVWETTPDFEQYWYNGEKADHRKGHT